VKDLFIVAQNMRPIGSLFPSRWGFILVSGFCLLHRQCRRASRSTGVCSNCIAPTPRHWARPAILGAFAIVATLADDELQWRLREMSCELPSLNVPSAENC
jgi:hypothetical protein